MVPIIMAALSLLQKKRDEDKRAQSEADEMQPPESHAAELDDDDYGVKGGNAIGQKIGTSRNTIR